MKTKVLSRVLILIVLVISLPVCQKTEGLIKYDITEDVYSFMHERYYDGPLGINLGFSTNQKFNCYDERTTISYTFSRDGYDIKIKLKDILIPEDCWSSLETPVQLHIPFGKVKSGDYIAKIKIGSSENRVGLTVKDSSFYCYPIELKNLTIRQDTIRRIPKNVLWGAFCYQNERDSLLGMSLIDTLNKLPVSEIKLPDGNYNQFLITDGKISIILWHEYGSCSKNVCFIYGYDFDDSVLHNIMEEYRMMPQTTFFSIIRTSNGSSLRNIDRF